MSQSQSHADAALDRLDAFNDVCRLLYPYAKRRIQDDLVQHLTSLAPPSSRFSSRCMRSDKLGPFVPVDRADFGWLEKIPVFVRNPDALDMHEVFELSAIMTSAVCYDIAVCWAVSLYAVASEKCEMQWIRSACLAEDSLLPSVHHARKRFIEALGEHGHGVTSYTEADLVLKAVRADQEKENRIMPECMVKFLACDGYQYSEAL